MRSRRQARLQAALKVVVPGPPPPPTLVPDTGESEEHADIASRWRWWLAAVLSAAGCSPSGGGKPKESSPGFAECDSKPNTCKLGPTRKGGTFVVVIEGGNCHWNIIDSDGNAFETAQAMTGA